MKKVAKIQADKKLVANEERRKANKMNERAAKNNTEDEQIEAENARRIKLKMYKYLSIIRQKFRVREIKNGLQLTEKQSSNNKVHVM